MTFAFALAQILGLAAVVGAILVTKTVSYRRETRRRAARLAAFRATAGR